MAESMSVNGDAFNIVGKTYAELAGTYGPGSLSVIGDDQYIVFRGEGGNFRRAVPRRNRPTVCSGAKRL